VKSSLKIQILSAILGHIKDIETGDVDAKLSSTVNYIRNEMKIGHSQLTRYLKELRSDKLIKISEYTDWYGRRLVLIFEPTDVGYELLENES
jgi:hypothetical protein